MMTKTQNEKILTIPNALSAFRICLIPVFAWLYSVEQNYIYAGGILALSGLTDALDGFIARKFNSVSNFGKMIDPVADKLTQAVVLFCLINRFPLMMTPFILLIVKEIFSGATNLLVIRKTGQVYGANWHGKVATILLYAMMLIHVIWYDIPENFSKFFIMVCVVMMTISFVLYGIRNIGILITNNNDRY